MVHSAEEIVTRAHDIAQRISTTYDALFDERAAFLSESSNLRPFLKPEFAHFEEETVVDTFVYEVLNGTFPENTMSEQTATEYHTLHAARASEALNDYVMLNQQTLRRVGLSQALDPHFIYHHVGFDRTQPSTGIYTFHETRAYSMFIAFLEQHDLVDETLNDVFRNIQKRLPNIQKLPDVAKLRVDRAIQLTMLSALHDTFDGLEDSYSNMPIQWIIPVFTDYVANEFLELPVEDVFFMFPTMQRFRKVLQKA